MQPKYKVGDNVVVIKYGHKIWHCNNGEYFTTDMCPEIVGQNGIIVKAETVQNIPHYAVDGIDGKHAWYDEDQLQLI